MSSSINKVRRLTKSINSTSTNNFTKTTRRHFNKPNNNTFYTKNKLSPSSISTSSVSSSTKRKLLPPRSIPPPPPPDFPLEESTTIPSSLKSKSKRTTAFPDKLPPIRIKPSIVYEDSKFLVINKRSGLAIQGVFGSTARISWDQTLEDLKARPGCTDLAPVHRLDRDTTGCLVFAKSTIQAKKLSSQFQSQDVKKTYLAVVNGSITLGYEGEIDTRLMVGDERVRSCGEEEGAPARTKWRCMSSSPKFSLLQLEPSTGRKHQLRVHLAETLNASIIGDYKYSTTSTSHEEHKYQKPNSTEEASLPTDTMLLHSSSVSFYTWDKLGKRSTIEARAKPPIVFTQFCETVGLNLPKKGDDLVKILIPSPTVVSSKVEVVVE